MLNPGPTSALSFNNLLGADFSRGPVRLIPEQSDGVIESYMLSSGPFLRYSSTWYIPSHFPWTFGIALWKVVDGPVFKRHQSVFEPSTRYTLRPLFTDAPESHGRVIAHRCFSSERTRERRSTNGSMCRTAAS